MNKSQAATLIDQHRRRWRSKQSDSEIARRARRAYLALAVVHAGFAAALFAVNRHLGPLPRIIMPLVFMIAAAIYFWQCRRFTQIRKLLGTLEANSDLQG